jgi:hypothetical protein
MKMKVEPRTSLLLGERKCKITIGDATFETPAPAVTNTDIFYVNQLMDATLSKIVFKNKVLEIRRRLFNKTIGDILFKANNQKKFGEWIDQQISMAKSSSLVSLSIFTPTLQSATVNESLIEELVNLQLRTKLDIVNIPDIRYIATEKLAEIIKKQSERVRKKGKLPFYMIPMDQDNLVFSRKIEAIKPFISGITATYADFGRFFPNFDVLRSLISNNNIIRVLSRVSRYSDSTNPTVLYPLSFLCADIFSVEYPLYTSSDLTEEQRNAKEIRNAKRFDLKNFEYYTVQLHNEKIGKSLNCNCPICDGRTIDDLPIDFIGFLTAAFRVHETFAIQDFVSRCLDSYEIGKTFEFLKDSPPVMRAMKDTFLSDRMTNQQMLPTS